MKKVILIGLISIFVLFFNQVDWNVANLQILWIKEYGFGVAGEALLQRRGTEAGAVGAAQG